MASINASLMKHKIILGLDDRGRLSCHKVNLCYIYMDPADCIVSDNTCMGALVMFPRRPSTDVKFSPEWALTNILGERQLAE
jgi:hypothetical protein